MARILLFGPLRDVAGWRERELNPVPKTLSALRAFLQKQRATLGAD